MSTALAVNSKQAVAAEQTLIQGDLSKLSPEERVNYYKAVCESLNLNPLTKPFEYISLNGKLILYAKRDCTDQLRSLRRVSITIVERTRQDDVYVVVARATTPDGRTDESTGAVPLGTLKGEALANALMKAETKAKRRVTLSICGLGFLDETEIETIPDARSVEVPAKHTPAGAAKVLQDAGLPVQFGSQIQQPTPAPSPPITREQADALGELVDGTFLESNDFLIVYGIDKLTDITQDSYAEVLQAARQVDAIRQLAVELNISPSKMLAPYADGTDGEPFFLALTEQQRADISMNLIKTKESRARKQQKQTA